MLDLRLTGALGLNCLLVAFLDLFQLAFGIVWSQLSQLDDRALMRRFRLWDCKTFLFFLTLFQQLAESALVRWKLFSWSVGIREGLLCLD